MIDSESDSPVAREIKGVLEARQAGCLATAAVPIGTCSCERMEAQQCRDRNAERRAMTSHGLSREDDDSWNRCWDRCWDRQDGRILRE